MSDLSKDIFIGGLFVMGLVGFISGEFIISSLFFATAAIASNAKVSRNDMKPGLFSWGEFK